MNPQIFIIKTPEGIEMEVDPSKVEGFVIGILGKKYEIIINEVDE